MPSIFRNPEWGLFSAIQDGTPVAPTEKQKFSVDALGFSYVILKGKGIC